MNELDGKIALVTGATRGIGQAISLALAQKGAAIMGTATTQEGADKISAYLESAGFSGKGFVLDVSDPASIEKLYENTQASFGTPHILVNNAGITRDNLFLRMKEEEWQSVIDTNLTAVFRITKIFMRAMLKADFGRIINLSSVVGLTGNAGQTNYTAAKAGVIGFTKSLAQEIASRNITVNCIAPGFIDTDMTKHLNEKQQEAILSKIPMQRMGQPEEIAAAVAFLASPAAGYITGTTLHVNGGMFME